MWCGGFFRHYRRSGRDPDFSRKHPWWPILKKFFQGRDPEACLCVRFKNSVVNGFGRGRFLSLADGYEMGDEVFGYFNAHKTKLNDREYIDGVLRDCDLDVDL
jgi:hypothetical protein